MLNRQTETLSARTVSYNRSILHRALEQARMWGYVSRNVVALTDAPRQRKSQIKPLTVMQAQQFLRAVKGHRLEILYRVALGLGLRRGEILALTWDDVDLTERRLNIIAGKTEASIRVLPLPPQLCSSLEKHKQGKAGSNWTDHNLVFPSQVGNPIHPRNLIRHFKSVLNDVQLPPSIRFHDLRHSCASFLIVQNVHPRSIMEILGHSQIAVTMNTYGHIELESQRLALEGLDAQFE
jgi:integrase